ncbi:hypothetical protein ACQP3F_34135, partial [Escherichia coli]
QGDERGLEKSTDFTLPYTVIFFLEVSFYRRWLSRDKIPTENELKFIAPTQDKHREALSSYYLE